MNTKNPWLLPDGVRDILPAEAWTVERLRAAALRWLGGCGYELVRPPLVEFVDSLLTGSGEDLDLQTYKVVDHASGRMMGVRPDMTPQVARLDARVLGLDAPARLCYAGPVLRAHAGEPGVERESLQCGAELFGSAGPRGDCEIIQVMLGMLRRLGVAAPHLDLGHVGIYRGLAAACGLSMEMRDALFDALQRKSAPDAAALLDAAGLEARQRERFAALAELSGGGEVLQRAAEKLGDAAPPVQHALANLRAVAEEVAALCPEVPLHIDLGELRGYRYHTGVVFAVFTAGRGNALALGGRYDDIGAAFGRARPATGFSTDLRQIAQTARTAQTITDAITAPWDRDPELRAAIDRLRNKGERVVVRLPEEETAAGRKLERGADGEWRVTGNRV